jgi:Subtilase family
VPAAAAPAERYATARSQEWWLSSLNVTQAWAESEGAGITVAVLGTGVDASYPGLAGAVTTGPDYTGSGRGPGSPYWGAEGTAVAGIIAGRKTGSGIVGMAPAAKILSVRVTLEFNDPLVFDQAISRRLPGAIADGIRYAVGHGARVIDLPLDPGTLGMTGRGDPAAAGGSPAERAAVSYALSKGVVLVAPAGDDGMGPGIVNYPAAYPGVIAVGAIGRDGHLASFSSRRSYVSLTAPGAGVVAAVQPDRYGSFSSTSTASGIVAGVAALVLSRFPHLTVAQVTRALIESTVPAADGTSLPPLPARSPAGAGYGTVNAARAMDMAAVIAAPGRPRPRAANPRPRKPARRPAAPPRQLAGSSLASSVLRDAVAGVGTVIVLLVIALLAARSRRLRARPAARGRARPRGLHEHGRPAAAAASATSTPRAPWADDATMVRPPPAAGPGPAGSAAEFGWPPPSGWQGSGIGELSQAPDAAFRPGTASLTRAGLPRRNGSGPGRNDEPSGPPWAPAPPPERIVGPLPVASASSLPPEPGPGIRVPGDMAAPAAADESPPAFGFDLADEPPPAFGFDLADEPPPAVGSDLSAAPVPADYAAPAEPVPEAAVPWTQDTDLADAPAADPSYIWDLAASDVFPPDAVPPDDAPDEGQG